MPRPPQNPLHLYPESPQKLHPNVQLNAPRHGLTAEYFSWSKPKETTRPICPPSQSGNRSIFVAQTSPARCVSEREKGGNFAPEDSKGRSPWRAFGDFPRDGKVTRGGGAERPPPWGLWGRSPHFGECRGGASPLANPPAAHGRGRTLFLKKIRRPRDFGKLAAALLPVGEKPLHLPPEGGAVVVM